MDNLLKFRAEVLNSCGASSSETQELLAYSDNRFDHAGLAEIVFPLADEPFVKSWKAYGEEVTAAGTFSILAKYLVQFRFPIRTGMSQDPDYLAATTRGTGFATDGPLGLPLIAPEKCHVVLHPTPAGHIPLLIAEERMDFVLLVQALARRNEPTPIPASMGACMVSGYNNWDRVFQVVQKDGAARSLNPSDYQDRFIILSKGYYSGVEPAAMSLQEREWRELSLIIRREHESTHYFTRRVFSSMRNNLLDEILADYCGVVTATGRFRPDWMLRFFGLEHFPHYRSGARLENYKGKPALSAGAFLVLQKLVKQAIDNLGAMNAPIAKSDWQSSPFPLLGLLALSRFTLEELASGDAPDLIQAELLRLETAGIGSRRSINYDLQTTSLGQAG